MKKIILIAFAVGSALMTVTPASAAGGCGIGFHRGPYGGCRPNRGPVVVVPARPAIGVYHPGRGYWDGRRYWGHRYWYHGGWRYR
jgi:hypothetical protein